MGILSGHSEHFWELYKPVERQISNYCRALAGKENYAHDLLQDTLLAAFENFSQLKKQESFLFYLCGIARRIYLKQLRRNKFKAGSNEIFENQHIDPAITGDVSTDIQFLYAAMGQLPIEQREALVMFEIMGLSLNEIQKLQGGSLSGTKSRVVRARQKLADMLTDQESRKKELINTKNTIV